MTQILSDVDQENYRNLKRRSKADLNAIINNREIDRKGRPLVSEKTREMAKEILLSKHSTPIVSQVKPKRSFGVHF